jgi:hypothetical protein
MTKEEMIQFLKDNLTINTSCEYGRESSRNGDYFIQSVSIELKLGDEVISQTTASI